VARLARCLRPPHRRQGQENALVIKDALLSLFFLLVIVVVFGWHIIWPWLKATASKHNVGLFSGDEMLLFPTAEANPEKAVHMKLYGVEARDWFVGTMRSKTLVRQQVTPVKPKIIVPA
jgi:hypothetical protein